MPVELHLHPIIHKFAAVRYYIAYLTYDEVTIDEIRDLALSKLDNSNIAKRAATLLRRQEQKLHEQLGTSGRPFRSWIAGIRCGKEEKLDAYEKEIRRLAIAQIESTPVKLIAYEWLHQAAEEIRIKQEREIEQWERGIRRKGRTGCHVM